MDTNQHDTVNIFDIKPRTYIKCPCPSKNSLYRRKRAPLIQENKFLFHLFSFGLVSVNYPIFQCFLKSNIFSTNIYPKSNLLFADLTQNKKKFKKKIRNPFSQDIKLE